MKNFKAFEPVTMADIAKLASVHVSTVSRALQEPQKDTFNPTTLRIRGLADELSFQPDATAARLRTGRSQIIGVTVPTLTDPVQATAYEGIDQGAVSSGYTTMVVMSANLERRSHHRADNLIRSRVDGIVIQDTFENDLLPEYLQKRQIPYLLSLRKREEDLYVAIDDLAGGRMAAEHLSAAGHVDVAVISPDTTVSTGRDRVQGFIDGMADHGVHVDSSRIVAAGFDMLSGQRAAEVVLTWSRLPTAIFISNDLTAVGAMFSFRAAGIDVGRDLALIGYNDIDMAQHLPVPLSTIASPLRTLGIQSAKTLLNLIDGCSPTSVDLVPHLVARESTLRWQR
ncbi:LacI family DNA-binding transcriptional regulator [Paeniglutamicibacter gangotriensis]|nr:LacI family DNA-binding transcriptional regulator [Paeniglutamicibacter gangotriensis]